MILLIELQKDVLDDLEVLGEATFSQVIEMTSNRLLFSGPTFWEDTDRGNLNIYYTSDQDQIRQLQTTSVRISADAFEENNDSEV